MKYNYKLTSHIPGVTVTLTKNPLNAKIDLTESAKREFALVAWTRHLVENYFLTARFYLAPRCGTNVNGVYTPMEPKTDEAIKWLERGEEIWYGEGSDEDFTADRLLKDELVQVYLSELNSEHSGDCTAFASSCCRCLAEEMLGVNTLPVGKGIGYRMKGLYIHHFGTAEEKERQEKKNKEWKEKYGHNIFWTPTFDSSDAEARMFFDEHQKLCSLYKNPKSCACGGYQSSDCQENGCADLR